MSIQTEIARIKEVRKNKRADYEKLFDDVKQLFIFAKEIQTLRVNVAWNTLLCENPEMKSSWDLFEKLLNETRFVSRVNALMVAKGDILEEAGALKNIKDRLWRDYVTISVMGPVSAGKSVFLQALTGLDNNVIPVSADTCTATKSFFTNSDSKSATVFFHKEPEIIKIIMKHIVLLNDYLKNRGNNTVTILRENEALGLSLSTIIGRVSQNGYLNDSLYDDSTIALDGQKTSDCTNKDYYKTLKHYIENYPIYSQYIGHDSESFNESQITSGSLKAFLAYDVDVTYANAVEHVEISWPLRASNGETLGDIHLVDTMGIGEAKLGVSENLTSTLRDEADIALALCAVKKAASLVQDPNTKMFQKILKNAIVGRKPEQWIYYLLNKYNDASSSDVEKMKSDLEESLTTGENKIFLNPNTWGVVQFVKQDGSLNRDTVLNYFTETVLFNLARSIGEIDEHFVFTATEEINSLMEISKQIKLSLKKVRVPSLDTKSVVRNILKEVKDVLAQKFDLVHAQNGDEIRTTLIQYFDENPLGCHFAYCFPTKSAEIRKSIKDYQKSLENLNPRQKIITRLDKLRDIMMPYINLALTKTDFENGEAFTMFKSFSDTFCEELVNQIRRVVENAQIIERFQNVKRDIWSVLINQGKLGSVASRNVVEWPYSFLELLDETNSYNDLKNAISEFNEKKLDLKNEILNSITTSVKRAVYTHNDFRYNTMEPSNNTGEFNDVQSWQLALFNLLKNKENEIINSIKSDYESFVGENVLKKQSDFLATISSCIFGQSGMLPNAIVLGKSYPVYDQLEKFYIDNYSKIFGENDVFSKKVEAVEIYNRIIKNI